MLFQVCCIQQREGPWSVDFYGYIFFLGMFSFVVAVVVDNVVVKWEAHFCPLLCALLEFYLCEYSYRFVKIIVVFEYKSTENVERNELYLAFLILPFEVRKFRRRSGGNAIIFC